MESLLLIAIKYKDGVPNYEIRKKNAGGDFLNNKFEAAELLRSLFLRARVF